MKKIFAKKSLGQNFLWHHGTLQKILHAAAINKNDHVVEIGPGKGALTLELAKRAKKVTAIELDERLIPILKEKIAAQRNVKLLHADALKVDPPKTPYKVVANLPYYITSPLLNHFLKNQPPKRRPTMLVVMVQKEVAEKLCAKPGEMNVLAVHVQLFGRAKIIAKVPAYHFKPTPKVDSAIVRIEVHPCMIKKEKVEDILKMVHHGFAHKRKKLLSNLKHLGFTATLFKKVGLNEQIRAQDLSVEEWLQLTHERAEAEKQKLS